MNTPEPCDERQDGDENQGDLVFSFGSRGGSGLGGLDKFVKLDIRAYCAGAVLILFAGGANVSLAHRALGCRHGGRREEGGQIEAE